MCPIYHAGELIFKAILIGASLLLLIAVVSSLCVLLWTLAADDINEYRYRKWRKRQ